MRTGFNLHRHPPHKALAPIQDSSGSEYPGESPSEIEELPAVQENASFSSDAYDYTQEPHVEQFTATPSMVPRLPVAVKEDSPKVCQMSLLNCQKQQQQLFSVWRSSESEESPGALTPPQFDRQ